MGFCHSEKTVEIILVVWLRSAAGKGAGILRLWFLMIWLLLVSPGGQSLFSWLSALANPDQSAAAASTDDDPADDGVVPTDCLFHLCRFELPDPARTVLRQAPAR
jgi:hypothetical protein